MNSNEYIKTHLVEDYNLNLNQDLERDINVYESYVNSLKLFRNPEVVEMFNSIISEKIIYNSLFTGDFPRHRVLRFMSVLQIEGFIEITNPTEKVEKEVELYLGKMNLNKITYYSITKKGNDLITNKKIKRLLKWD
jgi:hypothetical protein|tara:strand:+ start:1046 stop:1453 length:408 start_codon:yes stop_codon:yes gene_type:complete